VCFSSSNGAESRAVTPMAHKFRSALRSMLLGPTDLPQACNMGLREPQTEVAVWLHGMGAPRDVTFRHSVACAAPFLVCIEFAPDESLEERAAGRLSLKFCERGGDKRLLGEIGLRLSTILPTAGPELCLFEARSCTNFCLPRARMWAHDLLHAYIRSRTTRADDVKVSVRGDRCNSVIFICPRPVVLVSVLDGEQGNIFPMNLMGSVGDDYLAFALNSTRKAAPMVEHAGHVALSSVPFERAAAARALGKNHHCASVDWEQLPFATRRSAVLGIPVPEFALRVRELEIQIVRQLGSHTFFVGRVLGEQRDADGPAFCMIHGLYEAWRQKNGISTPHLAPSSAHA
jgi:flavin reductase (DIM6/NTAB) family NADH-FMN oxidoreductase RutF